MRPYTRFTVFLAVFTTAVLTGATVMAAPIELPVGPLFVQYTNNEQFSATNKIPIPGTLTTEGNWGILQISSIVKGTALITPTTRDIQGGGANVFTDGQAGGNQITGIFYGTTINSDGASGTGGAIDLYWRDKGTANTGADGLNPALRLNQKTYTGYAEPLNPNFIFLAQLVYGPGCDSNPLHNVCTGVAPGTGDGVAKSYQSVNLAAGGVWASQLNSNFFTLDANGNPLFPAADVRTDSNFTRAPEWDGTGDIIGLRSNDPVRADVLQPVPEPATLSLFGLGMLGVGYLHRRLKKK